MASYRPRGGPGPPYPPHRPYPLSRDDRFDDHSRSSSGDRRPPSPHSRPSPPQDSSRTPTGAAAHEFRIRGHSARSPDRRPEHLYDRPDFYDDHDDRRYDRRASTSPRRARRYHDRDDPRPRRSRSRSRSRSRGRTPPDERPSSRGRPSKEIIMEGLDTHLTENHITAELKQYYHVQGLENVRVIRDRQTKQSRQFGFLRFTSLEDAELFMDRNYPAIYLYGDGGHSEGDSSKVRIAFGRERKDPTRKEEPDWICAACHINNFATRNACFRCLAVRPDPDDDVEARPRNVGDNDASADNAPSQFLLLRGLEYSVSEELLAKGVAKLNKPGAASAPRDDAATKKGAKVASTTADTNLGAKDGALRRVLLVRDRQTNDSWRYGFAEYASIEDAQAALIRYHALDKFTIASKQVLVSYIHAGVFVPVVNPTPSTDRFHFSPLGNPAVKLAYWDDNAYVTELPLTTDPPEATSSATGPAPTPTPTPNRAKDADKSKKRKAQPESDSGAAKKPAPSHLQFWSNRHAELHGIDAKHGDDAAKASDEPAAPPLQSFADPTRHCCYLCMRQFGTAAEVNKHERLSDLHRQNLLDPTKVQKAGAKLDKHGVPRTSETAAVQYRDRARERRKIYGVVNKKGEQVGNAPKASKGSSDNEDAAMPVPSKGASLLSKMGYTAGQGLGASGEGMTAPISQDIYVAGVGLGAEGGRVGDAVAEAERNTRGDYAVFAEKTREGARERYAKLG